MSEPKKSSRKAKTQISNKTEDLFEDLHYESRANEPYEGAKDFRLTRKVEKPLLDKFPEDEEANEATLLAIHKAAIKPNTNSASSKSKSKKKAKSRSKSGFFTTRRSRKREPEPKKLLKNQPYIERDSEVEYMTDDEVYEGDLTVEAPNIAIKNPVNVDLQGLSGVGRHERTHFRAIKFHSDGQLHFYDSIVSSQANIGGHLKEFVDIIVDGGKPSESFEIYKRVALRNWVLNSPLPYKAHKHYKQWQNEVRNGIDRTQLDIPTSAWGTLAGGEVTTPYDFLDVTRRLRLDTESVLQPIGATEGEPETESEKQRRLSEVTASTLAREEYAEQQELQEQEQVVKQVEQSIEAKFERWYSVYLRKHPKSTIADLEYLNRMFMFNTTANDQALLKCFHIKSETNGEFVSVSNEIDYTDVYLNGIEVDDIIVMGYTEEYEVSAREKDQFGPKLTELHNYGQGLSLFITLLHQQYSLRELCENSNFWREELYTGYDKFVQRKFLVHTLIDNWTLASVSNETTNKELIASPDVFSSESLAVEDLFGESSPLYFKGNVTYVLLYDKSVGVNQRHTLDLDVLALVTKTEYSEKLVNSGLTDTKEERLGEKRSRLLNQLRAIKYDTLSEETKENLEVKRYREKVNARKRRIRRASFSAGSRDSSSDSDDSILTENDSELEVFIENLTSRGDPQEMLNRLEAAKAELDVTLTAKEEEHMRRLFKNGNAHQPTKNDNEEEPTESSMTSILRSLGKHKASLVLLLLALVSGIVVVCIDSLVLSEPSISVADEVEMKKIQYAFIGLGIFFFVLSCCLVFIKIFNEAHLVDSRSKFLQTALEGKNFVVTNNDIQQAVTDKTRELNAEEGIRTRKNHRLIVLITNFVSGDVAQNAIDTKHTVSNTIGNITRIADATFKTQFKLNQKLDGPWEAQPEADTLTSKLNWRTLELKSVQEISSSNTNITAAVHLAHNEQVAVRSIAKRDKTLHYADFAGEIGTNNGGCCSYRVPNPLIRYFFALLSLVWCALCLFLMYKKEDLVGFYLLSALLLPALLSSWENPLSLLLGWYFSMHYGPSGGLVGRLLVSSHNSTYRPSLLTQFYSIVVTSLPIIYLLFKIGESENSLDTTVDDLYVLSEEPLTLEVVIASIVIVSLTVISNISNVASFSRRYYLECLEILSKPNCLFKAIMSLYFAIEWLNLRTETCLFLFNVSTKDSRLLLSEIADLGRFFTSGDDEQRAELNKYGVPIGIGGRARDALWGLIDAKTRQDIVISPIDPGFKSVYFQASGVSVFASIYYSTNFYRNSVVGLRNASFARVKAQGAVVNDNRVDFNVPTLKVKTKTTREKIENDTKNYQPVGSFVGFIFFWHIAFILAITLETVLYLPIFAFYLCCYFVSTIFAGALIAPVGLVFMLFEAGYSLVSPGTLETEAPNNFLLQLLGLYGVLVLLAQMLLSFWLKLIVTSFVVTIKIILSKLCCHNIEYFLTPKLPLYFLPPLSVTEVEQRSTLKRKRLFKFSDGGFWTGSLPFFSEIPLFPKTQALNMNLVDVRESGDCVVRGKVRNDRDEVVGFVDGETLNEVGLSR